MYICLEIDERGVPLFYESVMPTNCCVAGNDCLPARDMLLRGNNLPAADTERFVAISLAFKGSKIQEIGIKIFYGTCRPVITELKHHVVAFFNIRSTDEVAGCLGILINTVHYDNSSIVHELYNIYKKMGKYPRLFRVINYTGKTMFIYSIEKEWMVVC